MNDGGAWRQLMAAVLLQAVQDSHSPQPEKALDAVLFLTGNDVPLWCEAVGLPSLDGLQFVTSGTARTNRAYKRGVQNG